MAGLLGALSNVKKANLFTNYCKNAKDYNINNLI